MSSSSFDFISSGDSLSPPAPQPPSSSIGSRYGLLRYEWDEHAKRISVFPSPDVPAFASPATQKQFRRDGLDQILDLLEKLEVLGVKSYVDEQKEQQKQEAARNSLRL